MPDYNTIQMVVTVNAVDAGCGTLTECTDCGCLFLPGDVCYIKRDYDNHARLVCMGCVGDKR